MAFKIVYDQIYVNHNYYYKNDNLLMVILLKIIKNNLIVKNLFNFFDQLFKRIKVLKNYLYLAINRNFSYFYFNNQKS